MRVFISWSGTRSQAAAEALRDWLPNVIQSVDPWLSSQDIAAGKRWNQEIARNLDSSAFGIVCVTKASLASPWVLFEAGALAKSVDDESCVIPYLIGLKPTEVESQNPLAQFQMAEATKDGTSKVVNSVFRASRDQHMNESRLDKSFEKFWPDLEASLSKLPADDEDEQRIDTRGSDDLIRETLDLVRSISRRMPEKLALTIAARDRLRRRKRLPAGTDKTLVVTVDHREFGGGERPFIFTGADPILFDDVLEGLFRENTQLDPSRHGKDWILNPYPIGAAGSRLTLALLGIGLHMPHFIRQDQHFVATRLTQEREDAGPPSS